MTEEEEEIPEHAKTKCKIIWVNGEALIDLSHIPIKKNKEPANHPYTFGWLQEEKKRQHMPDILKELQQFFKFPLVPGKWKVYKYENGQYKEIKEDEEDADKERERKT